MVGTPTVMGAGSVGPLGSWATPPLAATGVTVPTVAGVPTVTGKVRSTVWALGTVIWMRTVPVVPPRAPRLAAREKVPLALTVTWVPASTV